MIFKNMELHNCRELVPAQESFLQPARVPGKVREALSPIGREFSSLNTAGVELRFEMCGDDAGIELMDLCPQGMGAEPKLIEVYFGEFQDGQSLYMGPGRQRLTIRRPENMELMEKIWQEGGHRYHPRMVRVVLPSEAHIALGQAEGNIKPPGAGCAPEYKWLAYGSSITQGSNGLHMSGSYVSLAARRLGRDVYNLGLGGSALMEAEMADFIAGIEGVKLITLEMGINMVWDIEHGCIGDPELFRRRLRYFIPRVARSHRDIPVVCLDIFTDGDDYGRTGQTDLYRRIVAETVEEAGEGNLTYICCRDFLSGADRLCTDFIHPSAEGCGEIARKLCERLEKII